MTTIEQHIQKDRDILDNPTTSPAARRPFADELHSLEFYL